MRSFVWFLSLTSSFALACGDSSSDDARGGNSGTSATTGGTSVTAATTASATSTSASDASSADASATHASSSTGVFIPGNPDPEGSSMGDGGLTCDTQETLAGSNRAVCVAHVGMVELKITLPADAATNPAPFPLALYLHGDGAGAHNSNSAARTLLPWVDAHHAIFVSALAPNRCSWWIEPAYATCSPDDPNQAAHRDTEQENAPLLDAAMKALRAAYDLENKAVFYYGSSGGSMFLSGSFFGLYGHNYPGVLALNCGGEKPWTGFAWDVTNPIERGATKLYFTYGNEDIVLIPELASVPADFVASGFPVDDFFVAGQNSHCIFGNGQGAHQRTEEVWNAYINGE